MTLTIDVPDVHTPHPALVERFGDNEPLIRQMGSALCLAFILTASHLEQIGDPMAKEQLKAARDAYLAAANPDPCGECNTNSGNCVHHHKHWEDVY